MNATFWGLWIGVCGLVLCTSLILSPPRARPIVGGLVAAGFCAALIKIWLFQQAPQWHDINPDSITYDLNARAFALHWQGLPVDAHQYLLRGLQARHELGLNDRVWQPHDTLGYAGIVGSYEWLYAAYLGLWYWLAGLEPQWAIYSNAAFAAFFPAAAFGIATALGAAREAALLAAALALLDPSAGVNASWLLKDTLAGFLAMAALWGLARFACERTWVALAASVPFLGLIGGVRYVAFFAVALGAVATSCLFASQKQWKPIVGLATALAASVGLLSVIYFAPHSFHAPQTADYWAAIATSVRPISGGLDTLNAERGDRHADETVLRWKEALRANPALAVIKSIAHTLFAPYPWVAFHPGLTWRSFSELYYPGVILWMLCLPGIAWSIWRGGRSPDAPFLLVAVFLGGLLAAYTLFHGEWSTRQRVFALPAFFALAAIGWSDIAMRWRARRAALSKWA